MKLGPEDILQIQVCEWVKNNTDLPFYHYANERKASPQYCAILKRKGVKSGVADLHFPKPNGTFKDLWLELKAPAGIVSDAQAAFLRERIAEGSCAHIAYSLEEAIFMIEDFYDL